MVTILSRGRRSPRALRSATALPIATRACSPNVLQEDGAGRNRLRTLRVRRQPNALEENAPRPSTHQAALETTPVHSDDFLTPSDIESGAFMQRWSAASFAADGGAGLRGCGQARERFAWSTFEGDSFG